MNYIEASYNDVVDLLVKNNIVCIFQGRTEAGPRALGNRSVLYDPRDSGALRKVNAAKNRQWWRPFAASVLEEHAAEWFEMLTLKSSPYMMYAIPVKEDKKELIPGVVHVDGALTRVRGVRGLVGAARARSRTRTTAAFAVLTCCTIG